MYTVQVIKKAILKQLKSQLPVIEYEKIFDEDVHVYEDLPFSS